MALTKDDAREVIYLFSQAAKASAYWERYTEEYRIIREASGPDVEARRTFLTRRIAEWAPKSREARAAAEQFLLSLAE